MRLLILSLFLLGVSACHVNASTKPTSEDSTAEKLLGDMRKYFNDSNEDSFYHAVNNYKAFYLRRNDMRQYFKGSENEILHDINFNHFYRAMKKANAMQEEMVEKKCTDEYFRATYLIGMIYSLKGNIEMAKSFFEKALNEVNHANPSNLISIYMDLANIEMDKEPEEALKNLEHAIDIMKAADMKYEYSDAIGFKTIVAFTMKDWNMLDESYNLYMQLGKDHPEAFSNTYYNYVMICKLTRDGKYDEALAYTEQLTNATDKHKMQLDIFKVANDTNRAYKALEKLMDVKDSVNNVIMSEELIGTAQDLDYAKMQHRAEMARLTSVVFILTTSLAVIIIILLLYTIRSRRNNLKTLKAKNKELEIARDRAQESDRMKMNFLNNMNHEIRTPLNIISGFAQIVSSPNFDASPEDRKEISRRIQTSSNNITRIIEELLDISSKESVNFLAKDDNVSCNELCRKAIDKHHLSHTHESSIQFKTELKDSFLMQTNEESVLKILGCLFSNAAKFSEDGIINMTCSLNKSKKQVEISVTDRGRHIPESDKEKIFIHFYKVDNYKEGIGLGLPLARRIARQLGGDVTLDDRFKEGARFVVSLPLD